jgi:hypothetical protein
MASQPHDPIDPVAMTRYADAVQALAIYWWGRDTKGDAQLIARQSVQALVDAGLLPSGAAPPGPNVIRHQGRWTLLLTAGDHGVSSV